MNQEIRNIDELIVELRELIEDYIMQMESHISGKDSSIGENLKRLTGVGTTASSLIQDLFFEKLENKTKLLIAALKENPDPAKSKEITDILLTPYEGGEYTVQMGSIAYGCFADNFLPFMEKADIEAMCDAYAERYDTSRMMPRQFDFLTKMCKILGRPKPKKKFFVR